MLGVMKNKKCPPLQSLFCSRISIIGAATVLLLLLQLLISSTAKISVAANNDKKTTTTAINKSSSSSASSLPLLLTKQARSNSRTMMKQNVRPSIFQEFTKRIAPHSEQVHPIILDYGPDGHPWEGGRHNRNRRNLNHSMSSLAASPNNTNTNDNDNDNDDDGDEGKDNNYHHKHNNEEFENNNNNNKNNARKLQDIILPQHPLTYPNQHRSNYYPPLLSSSDYQPIRLAYHTGALTKVLVEQPSDTITKIRVDTLKERVLPLMAGNFSEMLSVIPVVGGIPLKRTVYANNNDNNNNDNNNNGNNNDDEIIQLGTCFGIFDPYITSWDTNPGIQDTDLVVFISAFGSLGGADICFDDTTATTETTETTSETLQSTLAAATGCELDQYDRPVVGFVNFCLGQMNVREDGTVKQEVVDLFVSVAMHEFTHVLGINADMMKYYRDANTGEPLTPRPFQLENDANVICAPYGDVPKSSRGTILPSCNTILESRTNRGWYSWMVVLPTVTQVARNQFNCQSMEGVMLENQPTNVFDCFGSHFDERDYYSETMSAFFAQEADYFSPLSFALLQDSGWYWPNYKVAELSPFGHGAGCGFVQNDCIVDGQVPEYSKGFFCNEQYEGGQPRYLCDPSATHKAICDLTEGADPPSSHQYFPNPRVGPLFARADWCPIAREGTINCADGSTVLVFDKGFVAPSAIPEESYSTDSKCFERIDGDSLCLTSFCSTEPRVLTVKVGSEIFTCNSDFQEISFTSSTGEVVRFTCPRLSAACPDLFCPANCSGKGVCNFDGSAPYCECFDPNDSTDGCYDSMPKSPQKCERERAATSPASNRQLLSFVVLGISLIIFVSLMLLH